MAIKQKYFGIKKGSEIILNKIDKMSLENYLQKYEDGKEMQITAGPRYKQRTSGQPGELTNFNGYLFGVAYKIIGDEIGEMDLDYIHYWAQMSVGNVKGMPDGTTVPAGTSQMSGGEFAEYCSKVRIWAGTPDAIVGAGIYIPDPNECEYN